MARFGDFCCALQEMTEVQWEHSDVDFVNVKPAQISHLPVVFSDTQTKNLNTMSFFVLKRPPFILNHVCFFFMFSFQILFYESF